MLGRIPQLTRVQSHQHLQRHQYQAQHEELVLIMLLLTMTLTPALVDACSTNTSSARGQSSGWRRKCTRSLSTCLWSAELTRPLSTRRQNLSPPKSNIPVNIATAPKLAKPAAITQHKKRFTS